MVSTVLVYRTMNTVPLTVFAYKIYLCTKSIFTSDTAISEQKMNVSQEKDGAIYKQPVNRSPKN